MLGPVLCGPVSRAPLLPKLRGHFAEFLGNASSVGLGILSLSTCVGLGYGPAALYSGFSGQPLRRLRYSILRSASRLRLRAGDLPPARLLRLHRAFHSRHLPCACVPTFLMPRGTGISTCCPSATPPGLALGPDLPRADQLYPGNLGYPADRIPTYLSLLIPAFSLRTRPLLLTVQLPPGADAPLPAAHLRALLHGFGGMFQPRTFSARGLSASELLRTL